MTLFDYLWIAWLVLTFVFVIIELLSLDLMFLMLAVGSLAGLGASALGWAWWAQIVIAAVVSLLLVLGIRPVLLRALRRGGDPARSNVAALIGLGGLALRAVDETGGLVKLANGETWSARLSPAAGRVTAEPDASVVVSTIDGSTAVVTISERTLPHA